MVNWIAFPVKRLNKSAPSLSQGSRVPPSGKKSPLPLAPLQIPGCSGKNRRGAGTFSLLGLLENLPPHSSVLKMWQRRLQAALTSGLFLSASVKGVSCGVCVFTGVGIFTVWPSKGGVQVR